MTIQRIVSFVGFGLAALAIASFQGFALEHELVLNALAR
jgi:hypothetical protein